MTILQGIAVASAGTDGVESGYMKILGYIMTTDIIRLESAARLIGHINL